MPVTDFATQADEIARLFRDLSMALDRYRAEHVGDLTDEERRRLADNAQHLDDFSEQLTCGAIVDGLAGLQAYIDRIVQSTQEARQAVDTAVQVEKVLSIMASAVSLAAAVVCGNPATVASAVMGLLSTIGSDAQAAAAPSPKRKSQGAGATKY